MNPEKFCLSYLPLLSLTASTEEDEETNADGTEKERTGDERNSSRATQETGEREGETKRKGEKSSREKYRGERKCGNVWYDSIEVKIKTIVLSLKVPLISDPSVLT